MHVHRWAKEKGIEIHDPTNDERVIALVRQEIEERSLDFKRFERPRAFALAIDEFTPENGMMTPTLKLKRRLVLGKYKDLLDALYAKSKSDDAA